MQHAETDDTTAYRPGVMGYRQWENQRMLSSYMIKPSQENCKAIHILSK